MEFDEPRPPLQSKSSPQSLRKGRSSREGTATPTPGSDYREGGVAREGEKSARGNGGRGKGKGEGVSKHERSPEIVVEDVSGSSMSTSSFDLSIQLVNATSPPQIILKHMENSE